jgi:hypothetical protein
MDYAGGFYIGNMDPSSDVVAANGFSHNLEWVTAEAMRFIDGAHAGGGQGSAATPFFLYMNPTGIIGCQPADANALVGQSVSQSVTFKFEWDCICGCCLKPLSARFLPLQVPHSPDTAEAMAMSETATPAGEGTTEVRCDGP